MFCVNGDGLIKSASKKRGPDHIERKNSILYNKTLKYII